MQRKIFDPNYKICGKYLQLILMQKKTGSTEHNSEVI